jgi:hypothetical protein
MIEHDLRAGDKSPLDRRKRAWADNLIDEPQNEAQGTFLSGRGLSR